MAKLRRRKNPAPDLDKLITKKNYAIQKWMNEKGKLVPPDKKKLQAMALEAAELERKVYQAMQEEAIINLISYASLLLSGGRKHVGIQVLRKARNLTQNLTMKKWITQEIRKYSR